MADELLTEKIPDNKSVIVVSDLHFGGASDPQTIKRFSHFLKKVQEGDMPIVIGPGQEIRLAGEDGPPGRLLPPAKIILLGDILELWNPRMQDRNEAFLDALIAFLQLQDLPCDIIYVTGNHDEDVGDIVSSVDERARDPAVPPDNVYKIFKGSQGEVESLKIRWNGEHILEISPRHYPATTTGGSVRGLNIGGIHYVFVHGQQFDAEQITYTISKALGCRIDVIDFFQDLVNCSVIRLFRRSLGLKIWLGILSFIVLFPLVLSMIQQDEPATIFRWFAGGMIWIGFLAVFLKGIHLFGFEHKSLPSSPFLMKLCIILAVVEIVGLSAGTIISSLQVFELGYPIGVFIFLCCLFIIIIPMVFTFIQMKVYSRYESVRYYDVKKIYETALKSERYTYNAEVLVFGHTHEPGWYPDPGTEPKPKKNPRLLVNSGTWMRENCPVKDSFVYIDNTGIGLMKWHDDPGEITCTKFFPKGIIR